MKNVVEVTSANFEQEVLQARSPVLVDFFATWCGPCKMMAPLLDSLAGEFAGRIKFAKLDVDQAPELAGQFEITGVPTLLLFREGKPVQGMVGLGSAKALRDWLEKAAAADPAVQA